MGKNAICSDEDFYSYQLQALSEPRNKVLLKFPLWYNSIQSEFLALEERKQDEIRLNALQYVTDEEHRSSLMKLWKSDKNILE